MANNPEKEEIAYKEGKEYFGDPNCTKKIKYKHGICSFNSVYWWFRDKNNLKLIITDKIISDKYFNNVIPLDINKTKNLIIYYYKIDESLDINVLTKKYENYDIKFKKINFKPSEKIIYKTPDNKTIPFCTLCLIANETSIFDEKNFGIMKEKNGKNMRVYRIKDKFIYDDLYNQFLKLKNNE